MSKEALKLARAKLSVIRDIATTREVLDTAKEAIAAIDAAGDAVPVAWMTLDCINLKPCSVTLDHLDVEDHREDHIVPLFTHHSPPDQPAQAVEVQYHEIIYAVGRKYPNETRHQTALRYIRQAEEITSHTAQSERGRS